MAHPRSGRRLAALALSPLAVALVSAALAPAVRAEPHISVRTGYHCSTCHVNQTGGGKRNAFGVSYGFETLPEFKLPSEEGAKAFHGRLMDAVWIGADLRAVNETVSTASSDLNTFAVQEGNLYVDLILSRLPTHLYTDLSLAPGGTRVREMFALFDRLPGRLYVKAGRFFAPFGWRLLDDDAFIRADTGFNFRSPDDGLEIGWQPGRFSGSLAITNGNGGAADDDTGKRVSFVSSWAGRRFRLGASAATNRQGDIGQLWGGLLGGVKLHDRFVVLAEVDAGRREDDLLDTTTRGLVAWVEGDLWVSDGLNLKAAFDYGDPDRSEDGDEKNRVTLGGEWFVTPSVQLRLLWRRTDRPPEVHGLTFEDERELVLELHLYL